MSEPVIGILILRPRLEGLHAKGEKEEWLDYLSSVKTTRLFLRRPFSVAFEAAGLLKP